MKTHIHILYYLIPVGVVIFALLAGMVLAHYSQAFLSSLK
jgi:hypothetical protein